MMHMQEIWKDIPGLEGSYQASNIGNIRSLDRVIVNINGCRKQYKGRVLVQKFNKHTKYYNVTIYQRPTHVHRLVALAFLAPIENKKIVNHINGLRHDNRSKNLEWCTQSENVKHGWAMGRSRKALSGIDNPNYKHGETCYASYPAKCIICDNTFYPSRVRNKTCNLSCRSKLSYINRNRSSSKAVA